MIRGITITQIPSPETPDEQLEEELVVLAEILVAAYLNTE